MFGIIQTIVSCSVFAFAAPVNNVGKTVVSEAGDQISLTMQLTNAKVQESEVTIRATTDFFQVEIPGLVSTLGQQLYPLGKNELKSVLVAPTADQKGIRIKFVVRQKGTPDPNHVDVDINNDTLKISISKKSLMARLHSPEAVRHLLVNREQARPQVETSSESIKLVADGRNAKKSIRPEAAAKVAAVEKLEERIESEPVQAKTEIAKTEAAPEAIESAKSEAEIPIKQEAVSAGNAESSQWPRLAGAIGLLLLVTAGSAFFILKYTKKRSLLSQAPKMRILNQFHLGPKKQLMVVQVAGESMLLGVTDHNINYIKSLALLEEEMPSQVPSSFKQALDDGPIGSTAEDEFEYQGLNEIRDRVSSRLSRMRNI